MHPALVQVTQFTAFPLRRIGAAVWSDGQPVGARAAGRDQGPAPPTTSGGPESEMAVVRARIAGEYREMPGLRLTERQAQRLWNLDELTCRSALQALVDSGFLTRFASGALGLAPSV